MKKKIRFSYDEEIDSYLTGVMHSLKNFGMKNVNKSDALRFIIRQNQRVQTKAKRKNRSKDIVFL